MLKFRRVSEAIMYLTVCFNNKLWCPFLRPTHGFPIVFVVCPWRERRRRRRRSDAMCNASAFDAVKCEKVCNASGRRKEAAAKGGRVLTGSFTVYFRTPPYSRVAH